MTASKAREDLLKELRQLDPVTAAERIAKRSDAEVAELLSELPVGWAPQILEKLSGDRRNRIAAAAPADEGRLWLRSQTYPKATVGRLMEPAYAVFVPEDSVEAVTATLRSVVARHFTVYVYVVESGARLVGVVAFRELLFAEPGQTLGDLMLRDPFALRPEEPLLEAMHEVVTRHYPVYPVVDDEGQLLGVVHGQELFRRQAFEISAQAGAMVGVEKEERLATPWPRSLRARHPWLQLNLATAFVAGAVVGAFQDTLDEIVLLAAFLPVLAGQSGNTGAQALAIALRGLTLGEARAEHVGAMAVKEAWLGLLNGVLVGIVAAGAMYLAASLEQLQEPLGLALVVFVSMVFACVVSGVAGAVIPLALRRMGADPASASAIFLSTATDVISMGAFLFLATLFLL